MEGAEAYADVIGYLTQQTEVWVSQPRVSGKGAMVDIQSEGLRTPEQIQEFWEALREVVPDEALGYQPTGGEAGLAGIRLLHPPTKGVGQKGLDEWQQALHQAMIQDEQAGVPGEGNGKQGLRASPPKRGPNSASTETGSP